MGKETHYGGLPQRSRDREAVAEKYFNCTAAKLTKAQAVSIACVLPNPLVRNPKTVSQKHRTKYNTTYRIAGLTLYHF